MSMSVKMTGCRDRLIPVGCSRVSLMLLGDDGPQVSSRICTDESKSVSLLEHLVPEWLPEDAATRALAYILDPHVSPGMAKAFVDLLGSAGVRQFRLGRVEHDPSQMDDSRPDVTLRDAEGQPRVFVEATFWNGVNAAQPALYLRELPIHTPSALVFIAPHERIPGLWRELTARCSAADIDLREESVEEDGTAWARAGARTLLLTSWTHVLQALCRAAEDPAVQQDIIQLRGLTDRMEREAFPPLELNEVTDVALARRVIDYCGLVNKIADRLVSDSIASPTRKYSAGSYRSMRMVNRSMRVHGQIELRVGIELPAWRDLGITPLWCVLTGTGEGDWEKIRNRVDDVRSYGGSLYIPIRLKTGVEEDSVISDAVKQMRSAADRLLEASRHE